MLSGLYSSDRCSYEELKLRVNSPFLLEQGILEVRKIIGVL
jgi:hypothetical protein